MSTLEVVILSALGGIFALALLALLGIIVWLAWSLRKSLAAAQTENHQIREAIQKLLVENKQETKQAFDSAKASFQSLKQETKQILDLHAEAMKGVVSRINADAIVDNIGKFTQVCARLDTAINRFHKLILDNLDTDRGQTEYEPEQTAPERTEFGTPASQYSISQSAELDDAAEREAAAEVTAQSGGF